MVVEKLNTKAIEAIRKHKMDNGEEFTGIQLLDDEDELNINVKYDTQRKKNFWPANPDSYSELLTDRTGSGEVR